jgi:histidinol phosphatase-like enzyme (inositol monophosphatase family)
MTRSIEADLAFAAHLADAAWAAIRIHFRNLHSVEDKGASARPGFDPVTEGAMRALVEAERPGDGVTGEEFPETPSRTGYRWYFDPIDGTRAFVAGLPVWTTLIALADPEGTPILGVIDQPVLGERYLGWPGGARLDMREVAAPIRVSTCRDLRAATISTTDPFILSAPEQGAWNHLRSAARITRYGLDAYAYARLAAGTIDLVAESGLKSWDIAALIPVVRGAGGLVTDWRGASPRLQGQIVCAANEAVLEQALLALRRAAE